MTFGVDRLMTLPSDAGSVCALADALVADWLPWIPLSDEHVDAALPTALRWAYSRLGPLGGRLFAIQDPLVDLRTLQTLAPDSHGVVTFRRENQGVVSWGFRPDGGEDPAVLLALGDHDPRLGSPWVPYQHRLSLHLLEGVLEGALYCGEHTANMAATPQTVAALAHLPMLALAPHAMWTAPDEPDRVRWHGLPDAVIRNDANTWLWVVARTAADLLRVMVAIPGEWETFS